MSPAALLMMLIQAGLCQPMEFKGEDNSKLTVVVCPFMQPAPPLPDGKGPEQKG